MEIENIALESNNSNNLIKWIDPPKLRASEKLGVITNFAAKVLFLAGLGLTIYYTVHGFHAVHIVGHATSSHFCATLPFIICSSTTGFLFLSLSVLRERFWRSFIKCLCATNLIKSVIVGSMVPFKNSAIRDFNSKELVQFIGTLVGNVKDQKHTGQMTLSDWFVKLGVKTNNDNNNEFNELINKIFMQLGKDQPPELHEIKQDTQISYPQLRKLANYMHTNWIGANLDRLFICGNRIDNAAILKDFRKELRDGLYGYWYPAENATKAVILFHGNGTSAEEMLDIAALYHDKNYSVLIYEYRGCGINSDLKIDKAKIEEQNLEDITIAHKFVKDQMGETALIGAHGHSLGTALASMLAQEFGTRVVLDQPFSSLGICVKNVAKGLISRKHADLFVKYLFPSPEKGSPWDSKARLKGKKIFMIHGKKDDLMKGSDKELSKAKAHNLIMKYTFNEHGLDSKLFENSLGVSSFLNGTKLIDEINDFFTKSDELK